MKKLLIRSLSGLVYILIIVGTIYSGRLLHDAAAGKIVCCTVFCIIGLIGTYEFMANLAKKGIKPNWLFTFVIALLVYAIFFHISKAVLVVLPALMLSAFIIQLWRHDENPMASIGYTLTPSIWIMAPLALANLMWSREPGLLMLVFVLVWVNDTFAYLSGMLLGRHTMWERHSPKKTWEGTIGGLLFCTAAAIFIGPMLTDIDFSRLVWALIGLVCGVTATLGDLVESMFKRFCGVKDSGKIMPGHGGILDRFDSMLAVIPCMCAFLTLLPMIFNI